MFSFAKNMVYLMVSFFQQLGNFYCPNFQTFMVSVRGWGQDLSISYLNTQTVLLEMSCKISG